MRHPSPTGLVAPAGGVCVMTALCHALARELLASIGRTLVLVLRPSYSRCEWRGGGRLGTRARKTRAGDAKKVSCHVPSTELKIKCVICFINLRKVGGLASRGILLIPNRYSV